MFGWVDDCLHSVERKEGRTGRPISGFVTHVIPLFFIIAQPSSGGCLKYLELLSF